jgi:hypothetical protein
MITFMISALVGASLGLRFKVFVLGPVMILAAAATIAISVLNAQDPRVTAFSLLGVIVCLEIGYIAGCLLRTSWPKVKPLQERSSRGHTLNLGRMS